MTRLEVGLLECDHVAPHLRGLSGDYGDMFRSLFARHAPELDLVGYDVVGGVLPGDPGERDAWLITGSRHSVFDEEPWIGELLDLVRAVKAAGGVLAGVCFGHQAIAHALGGETRRSDRGWGVGVHTAGIVEQRPWMEPPAADVRLLMTHQDQVAELPDGATVLACSPHCDVAMFEVDGRMLGIQGHPEFTPAYAEALLELRADRIPPDVLAAARETLAHRTDEAVVARWIAVFLAGQSRG